MKKILVLGSGRSATTLIDYLISNSEENNWFVTVGDFSVELAEEFNITLIGFLKENRFNIYSNPERIIT